MVVEYREIQTPFSGILRVGGRRYKRRFGSVWPWLGVIAEGLGGLMGVRQRRSRRFLAGCRPRVERFPAGSWPLHVVLPRFAFGIVAGGLSRGMSGRCARGGSVVRFLQRAVLCEVGEAWMTPCGYGADGGGLFDAGHDP